MATDDQIILARTHLASARNVTVLTGAGISSDSGVPTFRGADGLWRTYRAEDLATPEAFARDPRLVWEWYNWRRELIATRSPNPAHDTLVELEQRWTNRMWLITQNVDGLHRTAGSQRLSEIHGNIWKVRCTGCGVISENREIPLPILPTCRLCHALLRPHIVWFGESLWEEDLHRCDEAEMLVASFQFNDGIMGRIWRFRGNQFTPPVIPFPDQSWVTRKGFRGRKIFCAVSSP